MEIRDCLTAVWAAHQTPVGPASGLCTQVDPETLAVISALYRWADSWGGRGVWDEPACPVPSWLWH